MKAELPKTRNHRPSAIQSWWWERWAEDWLMLHSTISVDVEELRAALLTAHLSELRCAMQPEDRAVYDALPDTLTVYRGVVPPGLGAEGLSWTLNKSMAEFFAGAYSTRFRPGRDLPPGALILTGTTPKLGCIFLGGRGEDEIVAPCVHVIGSEPAGPWPAGNPAPPALHHTNQRAGAGLGAE